MSELEQAKRCNKWRLKQVNTTSAGKSVANILAVSTVYRIGKYEKGSAGHLPLEGEYRCSRGRADVSITSLKPHPQKKSLNSTVRQLRCAVYS
jgi:hypothetical protein